MTLCPTIFVIATITSVMVIKLTLQSISVSAKPDKPSLLRRGLRFNDKQRSTPSGLTLGDLDAISEICEPNSGLNSDNRFIGLNEERDLHTSQQTHHQDDDADQQVEPMQLKRSIRKINLDLSGRIMCHLFSPNGDNDKLTSPLFSLGRQRVQKKDMSRNVFHLNRFIPRVYVGAYYDLDEIWYGATRWIGRCSWGLSVPETLPNISPFLLPIIRRCSDLANRILLTHSFVKESSWNLDLEREQSVFDKTDTTVRVLLAQPRDTAPTGYAIQKLTLEYDSAKYFEDYHNHARCLQYSPTVAFNIQTPLLHPRLEVQSKRTWIVKDGGDRKGNYYGGAHFGSESPADRRLEQMKTNYRESNPRANTNISRQHGSKSPIRSVWKNLSSWLENDGWMPEKITTDLMGNLVSVNTIGIGGKPTGNIVDNQHDMLAPRNNLGLKLRISKKIDWTKFGIFPWSNNNYNNLKERRTNNDDAARVRVELCGLNASGDKRAWLAIDADPLDIMKTFKVVVGHEFVHC